MRLKQACGYAIKIFLFIKHLERTNMKVTASPSLSMSHAMKPGKKETFDRFEDYLHAKQTETQYAGRHSVKENIDYLMHQTRLVLNSSALKQSILGKNQWGKNNANNDIVFGEALLDKYRNAWNDRGTRIREYIQKHHPNDPDGWRKVPDELEYFPDWVPEELKQVFTEYKQDPNYYAEEYQYFYWLVVHTFSGISNLQKSLDCANHADIQHLPRGLQYMNERELAQSTNVQVEINRLRQLGLGGIDERHRGTLFSGDFTTHYTAASYERFFERVAQILG